MQGGFAALPIKASPLGGRWRAEGQTDEGAMTERFRFLQGEFRRLRAASDFARGGKVTKTPPGTAQDGHFVSIFAFPRTPLRELPLGRVQPFRRAKSEWLV